MTGSVMTDQLLAAGLLDEGLSWDLAREKGSEMGAPQKDQVLGSFDMRESCADLVQSSNGIFR